MVGHIHDTLFKIDGSADKKGMVCGMVIGS